MNTIIFEVTTGNVENICNVNETNNVKKCTVFVHTDKQISNLEQAVSNYIDTIFTQLNRKPDFIIVEKSKVINALIFDFII